MWVSDIVNLPYEDNACWNGDCYGVCGEIKHPDGLDRYTSDVIIRQFRIALSEIDSYVGKLYCNFSINENERVKGCFRILNNPLPSANMIVSI